MNGMTRLGVGVVVCLAGIGSASADEGATPIWEPTVITEPGRYFLTRNISAPDVVVDIESTGVELDLNGFTLTGTGTEPVIRAGAVGGTKILHGRVRGGATGIRIEGASGVLVERVTIFGASGIGILLSNVNEFVVRDCNVVMTGQEAIRAEASFFTVGTIEENRIRNAGDPPGGVLVVENSAGSKILGNRLTEVIEGRGILLQSCGGCIVADNVIDDQGSDSLAEGIQVSQSEGAVVRNNRTNGRIVLLSSSDCRVSDNSSRGFRIDQNSVANLVTGNVVQSFSGSYGIELHGDGNQIESNLLYGKPGFGLYLGPDSENNVYRGNTARGNFGSGCLNPSGTSDFCDEGTGNTSHGDNYMPNLM